MTRHLARSGRLRAVAVMVAATALAGGTVAVATSAASAGPARVAVQAASRAATAGARVAAVPASSTVPFEVGLRLTDPAGAVALERSVSDPSSAGYRHFLTTAQWEARFSPSPASVAAVAQWLHGQGIAVTGVSPDRMTVHASGSAAAVAAAFGTSLAEYRVRGREVRLAGSALTVPASLASVVVGVSGIDETPATVDSTTGADTPIPQPGGFRNAKPCSTSYGQVSDTTDPAYGGGYPTDLPYAVCGYVPAQLQGAYGLAPEIARGIDGRGVTVAIVDAYASPTLFSDAATYARRNQATEPLAASRFSEKLDTPFTNEHLCQASGWSGEQTLDVEAVHATAPGASILYVGAANCITGLYDAVQQVVDGHLASIVTDSWGDDAGDLLDAAGTRKAFDQVLLMAGGTGIGVQFSAGDNGDEFTTTGLTAADYPSSSPYATSVGGTSLQVDAADVRTGELGWSTAKSVLCTTLLATDAYPGCTTASVGTYLPPAPGAYDYGGGGGTSYEYAEPWYQDGVVPAALAGRNSAVTGIANRVEPDVSMDADPTTGMLVGETQVFGNGTYYAEYRIGGTSLSSPLFAGLLADADQAAGSPLGFVNPLLYRLAAQPATSTALPAFYDVVPGGDQALVRSDFVNGVNAFDGTLTSVRVLDYQGVEQYCSGTGACTTQDVALGTSRGFDSMTGIGSPGAGLVAALARA